MINKNVVDTFVKVAKQIKLSRIDNGDDLVIYPNIGDDYLLDAIDHFKIDKDEEVLYFRDTSLFNKRNQGLVITDLGIVIIKKAKSSQPRRIYWSEVKSGSFDYTAQRIYYETNSVDRDEAIHLDNFLKGISDEDDYNKYGTMLVQLFNDMVEAAKTVSGYTDELRGEVDKLSEEGKYAQAVAMVIDRLNVTYSPKEQGLLYGALAKLYYLTDEIEKAQSMCERSCELCITASDGYIYAIYLLYKIYMRKSMMLEARRKCFSVLQSPCDMQIKDEAQKDFNFLEQYVSDHLIDIPYNERKVIMPVRDYVDLDQDGFTIVDMKLLHNLEFPVGHPIANQLYVGHPLCPEKYIPFEDYQLEFVEDKVREFCLLAQCLGATDITIECKNVGSSDVANETKRNMGGDFEGTKFGLDAGRDADYSHHMLDELNKHISLHQTFAPQSAPYLPDGLVWYKGQPSWQRLYKQRIDGGLTSHQERIETNKSQVVEDKEVIAIKGGVKYLVGKLNLTYEKADDLKFQKQDNAELVINVTFAPLADILNTQVSNATIHHEATVVENEPPVVEEAPAPVVEEVEQPVATKNILGTAKEEEADYIELLKKSLEDGVTSNTERRLLERIRIHAGIDENRAKELEDAIRNSFTPEEKEYMEEYKAAKVNGEVLDAEREMLDKLCEILGISASRASELEAAADK